MTLNYHDAFIPVITISKKSNNSFLSKNFFSNKHLLKKQNYYFNSSRANKSLVFMKIFSNYKLDAFEIIKKDIELNETNWKSSIQKLPSSYRRVISLLIFSSFFFSGWYLTPTNNRFISFAASVFSSSLSLIITNKINSKNSVGVKFKILEKIISATDAEFKKEIPKIQSEFNVNIEEIKNEIMDIYKKYIFIFLRDSEIRIEEILELIKIKNIFEISSQDIGECHIQIARDLYKEYTINLERKISDNLNDRVDKFLFLSDRIFSLDSPKGYQYEISRLRKVFLLSHEKITHTCTRISNAYYSRIIELSIKKKFYDVKDLEKFQEILGLKNEDKEKIHVSFIKSYISDILKKEKKIHQNDKNELMNLKKIFKIEDSEFQKIIFEETQPIFLSDIIDILNRCFSISDIKNLKNLSDNILARKEDLLVPLSEIKNQIAIALKNITSDVIKSIISNQGMQKKKMVLDEIETLFNLEENSFILIKSFNFLSQEDVDYIYSNGSFYNIGSNFKNQDIKQTFTLFLEKCIQNFQIKQEDEIKITRLKKILSISESDYISIYNSLVEPIYINQANKFLQDKKLNQETINELAKLQNSLKLNLETVKYIKINIYKEYLQKFIERENILSVENLNYLNQIRVFLCLNWSDVQDIHDTLNEPSYIKAITEAMGATGFISKVYWEGLEKLRKRLYITEKKAKEIFYKVSQEKLRQLFEQAVIENKRKIQLKNEGKDLKEDSNNGTALGIEAGNPTGNELSILIDFYVRNKIFLEKESPFIISSTINLKGINGRLESRTSMNIKKDYIYPVNLNGLFDKKTVSEMYKQYLVECFSSKQQNEKRRMFNNLDKLGPILGIEAEEINSIHSNVGSVVYRQFLAQALTKGYIDKTETAFLTSIQNTLSMDGSKCSELIKDAKKNRIAIFVESIFAKPKINSESVSELREMSIRLGVNLQNDLSLSNDQCSKLFRVEIDTNVEKGIITSENQNLVEEIRLAFGLSKESAKKIMLESITNRCEGHFINAIASLRKNLFDESLKEIEKLINFGNLLPIKMQSNFASKKEKEQLLSLFQSTCEKNETSDKDKFKIDTLKLMLNI